MRAEFGTVAAPAAQRNARPSSVTSMFVRGNPKFARKVDAIGAGAILLPRSQNTRRPETAKFPYGTDVQVDIEMSLIVLLRPEDISGITD